jgi:hypothetical protein
VQCERGGSGSCIQGRSAEVKVCAVFVIRVTARGVARMSNTRVDVHCFVRFVSVRCHMRKRQGTVEKYVEREKNGKKWFHG